MKFIREELSLSEHGNVNLETLGLIREHNKRCLNEKEVYSTNLCKANKIIRDLVLDNYESDGAVTWAAPDLLPLSDSLFLTY